MLNIHETHFHVAWRTSRHTARDFVQSYGLEEFTADQLADIGEHYLDFATGNTDDMALWRALQCLQAAAEEGVLRAQAALDWIEAAV